MKFKELVSRTNNIDEYNLKSIVDMALTWSATLRIFESGSKDKISNIVLELLKNLNLPYVITQTEFDKLHNETCKKIIADIKLNKRSGRTERKVSFGQAAKIVDMCLKVYVYLCKMPDTNKSARLVRLLNCPIDNIFLKKLKTYEDGIDLKEIYSLGDINEKIYYDIQKALREQSIYQENGKSLIDLDEIVMQQN